MSKILIVDERQDEALHMRDLLSGLGHEVIDICSNGELALDSFAKHHPDLILADVILGGKMSGIEIVKKLQENSDVQVIYSTDAVDEITFQSASSTNPIGYLSRQANELELKISLETHMKQLQKIKQLQEENELKHQTIQELSETNAHLVTATWRERELKQELQLTKALVEEQNNKIMDSINYAKRIQNAIIPKESYIKELLGEQFVFYKSKDVVSGDFPWIYELHGHIYMAAVDCTGHGVPGAMMSLIGFLLLNDIVHHEEKVKSPGEILAEFHEGVVKTLKQDDADNKAADGMDVALVCINKKTGVVQFSGAHRPLYHLHNGELTEYKGSKFPIGGTQYKGMNAYENNVIQTQKGDSIFFCSDGLPDQFGGPEKLKYGPKRIRRQIVENADKSMEEMKELFETSYENWMEGMKQIDDVLLIGIKL